MARQLSFDLPARPSLDRGDFFVSPANALAVQIIDAPLQWVSGKLVLYGPEGSGKSHLVHVWAAAQGARIVRASDLQPEDVPDLAGGNVAVEDVPGIAGDGTAQTALFHLHNLLLAEGHLLLMTGRGAPDRWALPLADLHSRIAGTQAVALNPPDDPLLAAVLAKLFADRQIVPKPEVIPYLLSRMDRSFAEAARIVDRLDAVSLSENRSITRPLAAQVLGLSGKGT